MICKVQGNAMRAREGGQRYGSLGESRTVKPGHPAPQRALIALQDGPCQLWRTVDKVAAKRFFSGSCSAPVERISFAGRIRKALLEAGREIVGN
ncbi:hypothetical protein LMG29739_02471 [Paraburkholderia solisilvae]|uniref:Uncharacterized protein n=1 Tax=Paraburkholderia solisilvae TaxID=624376 RepID=A0A6J5DU37_9BURK|nr:hypothetical protein LMG29739_02471 [Paraburkholderia solisilvae]